MRLMSFWGSDIAEENICRTDSILHTDNGEEMTCNGSSISCSLVVDDANDNICV